MYNEKIIKEEILKGFGFIQTEPNSLTWKFKGLNTIFFITLTKNNIDLTISDFVKYVFKKINESNSVVSFLLKKCNC